MSQSTAISFTDRTNLLLTDNYSGVCMAIADMNADGKDDIVRYNIGRSLNIEYQTTPNQAFRHRNEGAIANFSQWSNCIADIDKNGYNDILVGGKYDNIKILYNQDGLDFHSTNLPNSNIFLQGSNFIDIDNDGWIDIFACHDDGENREYKNNGSGQFDYAPNLINTMTVPASDNSGSYSSIWTDYDGDNDLDLYISKCKAGVTDPRDPRRVNMLLENDGDNNFIENAKSTGLDIGAQSWLAEFADIDNDGDMDAFIGNHYTDCQLMRNNGNGTYTDISANSGLFPTLSSDNDVFSVQAVFRDFNNDGFVDLLFSGSHHFLFYNNGNRTFSPTSPFPGNIVESFALGDLNQDGFIDVYAGYAKFFTEPSSIKDALFMNNGNSNNFIAVQLEGIESNINGIGAKVKIYGDWGVQLREVRSGEGYGIMNSFTQYFGIGSSSRVEKLEIIWPTGIEQTINNPRINQFHKVLEKLPCEGQSCDDANDCTVNDVYDAYCNCQGVFSDVDNDGVCDEDDECPGSNDNLDSDNDGLPNGCDSCPTLNNNLIGQLCDDGNDCSTGERYDVNCNCTGGTFSDSDNDGVCDSEDTCPGLDDNLIGQPCNDNNPCTTGEKYNASCGCSGGTYIDVDNDGVCIGEDSDDNDPCIPNSSAGPCNVNVATGYSNCSLIDYTDFEAENMGVWLDGGISSHLLTEPRFAASGDNSYSIYGNRGTQSSLYTRRLALSSYSSLVVSFSVLPYTMESGDSFVVEVATNGINYSIAKTYTIGINLTNNQRLQGSVMISGYNLTDNSSLRFRTITDESADYVILDNLSIEGCVLQGNCTAGAPCDDGNECTTGEFYDTNCNCAGGQELDSDSDGICDAEDICPFLNNYFLGKPCNDNNPCTTGELYDNNCGCSGGVVVDGDGDGFCAAEDPDDNNACIPNSNHPACNSTTITDCQLLNSTSFENGNMGIWQDGGSGAKLVAGVAYSNTGQYSFYVQSDNGSQSSIFSETMNLSSATNVILKFSLLPYSVESTDKLAIEIATNGTYTTYKTLVTDQDFTTNVRKEVIVNFNNINFSSNTSIRLRSICDTDNDYFIFDDLSLEVCGQGSSIQCTPGTNCEDGDNCTTGETYDANCNCIGGIYKDSDFDGVCDAEDLCPTIDDSLIGKPCDDGNLCTTGEKYDNNCNCSGGIYTDNDGDGYCAGNDNDDNNPCVPNANSPNCDIDLSDCAVLSSTNFENSDMGIWLDGGSSAKIINSSTFSNSGSVSFYIHDNKGFASSLYSRPQDYSEYTALKIDFFFYAYQIEFGDRFYVEIDNGNGNYTLIKTYRAGIEFQPGDRKSESLYIDNIAFSNRVSLRFRSATDEAADYFVLDDIVVKGCNTTLSCTPGDSCDDNNVCSTGERYDNNCNCVGGVEIDNDNDGYCTILDSDDNDPCVPDNSSLGCSDNSSLDCNHISFVDFENNALGIWNDGGSSARILVNSEYANSGSKSFYLQGDKGGPSSLYSDDLDLSTYSAARLSFYYTSIGIEAGDRFHVEISNNGNYETYTTYIAGTHFTVGDRKSVALDITGVAFSTESSIRLRSACEDDHYIIIDDIRIEGCNPSFRNEELDSRNQQSSDVSSTSEVQIYPNPTTGFIYLEVPYSSFDNSESRLDIYNLQGIKLRSIRLIEGQQELNLSSLEAGQLYLFRISNNMTGIQTHKIFKQ